MASSTPDVRVASVASTPWLTYRFSTCMTNSGLAMARMLMNRVATINSVAIAGLAKTRFNSSFMLAHSFARENPGFTRLFATVHRGAATISHRR